VRQRHQHPAFAKLLVQGRHRHHLGAPDSFVAVKKNVAEAEKKPGTDARLSRRHEIETTLLRV